MKVLTPFIVAIGFILLACGCSTTEHWKETNPGETNVKTYEETLSSSASYHFDGKPEVSGKKLHLRVVKRIEEKVQKKKAVRESTVVKQYKCERVPSEPAALIFFYPLGSLFTLGIGPIYDVFCIIRYAAETDPDKKDEIYESTLFWECTGFGERDLSTKRLLGTETRWADEVENSSVGSPRLTKRTEPGANVSVKVIPRNVLVNGKPLKTEVNTDIKGYLKVPVSAPKSYFPTPEEAKNALMDSLSEDYYLKKLESFFKTLELVKKERGSLKCVLPNDKATVEIPLFRARDIRSSLNEHIRSRLQKHLSEKYAPTEIRIDARDINSLARLDDVRLEVNSRSVLQEDTVKKEARQFLSQYLKNSTDYEKCMVNPKKFIFSLPENVTFSRMYRRKINIPSSYRVLITCPDYYYVKGKLKFKQNALHKVIHMSKLREKMDVKESEGQMDHGKIEDK